MVTASTVFEDVFELMYDETNSAISDPASRGSKWIFSSFPDSSGGTFPGYPILVIENPIIDSMTTANINRSMWNHMLSVNFSIYDTRASRIDSIGSDIVQALKDARTTFRSNGLYNMGISSGRVQTVEHDGHRIHFRVLTVVFDFAD